jgi:putative cardiolipin synthase
VNRYDRANMTTLRRLLLIGMLPLLAHCAAAPRMDGVQPSFAIPPAQSTRLDQLVRDNIGDESGVSGIRMIEENALAYAYRAATAVAAERTLDIQYYIWHNDLTGRLLAAELIRAAERGVHVRLLVDDADARSKHDIFRVADLHPNIEVRIFNPFYSRYGRLGLVTEYLTRGSHLTRRMHNKAWIADNRVAIIGGRNIGDEYFGIADAFNFADLDVMLAGAVVADVSRQFDNYWNSSDAVPVEKFDSRKPRPGELEAMVERALSFRDELEETDEVRALRDLKKQADVIARAPPMMRVTDIRLLVDDPAKIVEQANGPDVSVVQYSLEQIIGNAQHEALVFSPYLVPGKRARGTLLADAGRGVHVAVVTNSLAATDVPPVHTGYARYRRDLLRGGVELYEMKTKVMDPDARAQLTITGSSGAILHTKATVIDGHWVLIGSMNLDQRSAKLNTEMAILLDNPELAEQLRRQFALTISPELSYRVTLAENGDLLWYDRSKGQDRLTTHEPDTTVMFRVGVSLLRVLPIEPLL